MDNTKLIPKKQDGRSSPETKAKISVFHKGKVWRKGFKLTEEHKRKIGLANANPSKETRVKKSLAAKKRVSMGTHNFYKGGLTPINKKIRQSSEYRLWRTAVFERDGYTCIWCGAKSCKGQSVEIQADHIKSFTDFPELRFAIDNGRTLCRHCHLTTETFGWNHFNNKNKHGR